MALARLRPILWKVLVATGAAAVALAGLPDAVAHHGDIHARCDGDRPIILQQPPGTEYVKVVCRNGFPEFMVEPVVPTYDPVSQALPKQIPPDFAGWVTVYLNGRALKTPYDPIRGVQEPGAYLAASTGRVMMPVRFFTEAFGGEVDWSQAQRKARLQLPTGSKLIQLWLDEDKGLVGLKSLPLDQKPVLFLDRMFVPVRFLTEGFGGQVEWNHSNRSAHIQLNGLQCSSSVYCGEVR